MPDNPQILVHPIRAYANEKFTCKVMSLSILLDYRPEDTKKHCFEVSLFAELFNEMLMRDFGFNIYKSLFSLPDDQLVEKDKKEKVNVVKSDNDEPNEKKARNDDETTSNNAGEDNKIGTSIKEDNESGSNENKVKANDTENTSRDGNTHEKERDRDRSHKDTEKKLRERERRISRRDEESDDDHYSIRSTEVKRREHKKLVTVDPELLLSFVYFDQTHCGYIFSNHIEELFYALGLRLSRADTKKIISKISPRSLFYRFSQLLFIHLDLIINIFSINFNFIPF